jgi:hypothetical protein
LALVILALLPEAGLLPLLVESPAELSALEVERVKVEGLSVQDLRQTHNRETDDISLFSFLFRGILTVGYQVF